jgi:hypothetical protein
VVYKLFIGFVNSEDLILDLPEDIIRRSFPKSPRKAPEEEKVKESFKGGA